MPLGAALQQRMQQLRQKLPHRYAINAKALGDDALLPWSNLGLWDDDDSSNISYPQACQALAEHLAQALDVQAQHRLLDVGCGQGASLLFWREHYGLRDLTGVELQPRHVAHLRAHLPSSVNILAGSYTELAQRQLPAFDRIVCIDAAYHLPLAAFLQGIKPLCHLQTRIGLHYVMLSQKWAELSIPAQRNYGLLLKAADIQLQNIPNASEIAETFGRFAWHNVEIEDLTANVFGGFARYMQRHRLKSANLVDALKIGLTAKLCQKLADEGYIRYVQITAKRSG